MEVWSDVVGYEGIYEVSNIGRVRSKDGKKTQSSRHGERIWKSRILKSKINSKGYERVSLYKNKTEKTHLVHRLVAKSFCENEFNLELVNHKDGNPRNNKADNLEWCDYKYNSNHAFDNGLMSCKKILLTNKEGKTHEFRSMTKASLFIGKNKGYISDILKRGKREVLGFTIKILK